MVAPPAQSAGYVANETEPRAVRQTIKYRDKNGEDHDVLVPYSPNPKCKKCYGRGYLGLNVIMGGVILCPKCYSKQ